MVQEHVGWFPEVIRFPGFPPEPALDPIGGGTDRLFVIPAQAGIQKFLCGACVLVFPLTRKKRCRGRDSAIDARRCCGLERRTRADTPGRACRPLRGSSARKDARSRCAGESCRAGVGHPLGAGIDRHARLQRHLREAGRVDCIRQLHPQEDPAGGIRRTRPPSRTATRSASIRTSSLRRRVCRSALNVGVEAVPAVFREDHLLERARPAIALDAEDAAHQRPAGDEIAEPQRRCDRLRERADMDDAVVARHAAQRLRPLSVPDQIRVALVLEDRHAVGLRELRAIRRAVPRSSRSRSGSAPSESCRCTWA